VGLAPAAAWADLVPAPPGQASAVAAQVGALLDVSKTGATAGSGDPSAEATVVHLAGQPLLGLGGSQTGDGETGGSLLDTGAALPARVQVAPWHAAADGTHGPARHARGSAAVARAGAPGLVSAGVLTSDSAASYTDQQSSSTAVTNGLDLQLLDALRLVLLHSEVSTNGRGHSYLVGLNGTEIGTDDQLGASPLCALKAPNLLSLSCLNASGGSGTVSRGAAQVIGIDPVLAELGGLAPVAGFTAAASSGTGQPATVTNPAPTPAVAATETSRAVAPAAVAPATTNRPAGTLPRTGATVASLLAAGLALAAVGFGLRRLGPRAAIA